MAAKYITQYALTGLTPEQFSVLLLEASRALGWQMYSQKEKFYLVVPRNARSNGQTIIVATADGMATIESKNSRRQFRGGKKNKQNLIDIVARLDEARLANTPEGLTEKYIAVKAQQDAYIKDLEERKRTNNLTAGEKITLSAGGRYVTYTLIGINLLIFIMMVINGAGFMDFDVDSLIKWGGDSRVLTANGEWYRLLTSVFLHIGLLHVLFNMYALLFIGIYLEPLLGRWRYLTVYLACGVFASLTSIWWSGDSVSVGASGAIFGLYGVFLALLTTNFIEKHIRKPMLQSIVVFVIFNLVYGTTAGIDNAAHVGGLLSGMAFGYLYYFGFIKRKDNSAVSIAITVVLAVAAVYFILPGINKRPLSDNAKFINSLHRLDSLQAIALQPMDKLSNNSFSPGAGEDIRLVSLPAWQQCRSLLDSAGNYDIAKAYTVIRDEYKRYVDLRIKEAQLYVHRETEKTNRYNKEIDAVGSTIKNLVDSMNSKQ